MLYREIRAASEKENIRTEYPRIIRKIGLIDFPHFEARPPVSPLLK
jgi:hypothetical protein